MPMLTPAVLAALQGCYQLFWLFLIVYGAPAHLPHYHVTTECETMSHLHTDEYGGLLAITLRNVTTTPPHRNLDLCCSGAECYTSGGVYYLGGCGRGLATSVTPVSTNKSCAPSTTCSAVCACRAPALPQAPAAPTALHVVLGAQDLFVETGVTLVANSKTMRDFSVSKEGLCPCSTACGAALHAQSAGRMPSLQTPHVGPELG